MVIISLLLYWSHWPLTGEVTFYLFLSLSFYFYYQRQQGWSNFKSQLKGAAWLFVYLLGVVTVSYFGGKEFGGTGLLSSTQAQIILVVFALAIYYWSVQSAWLTPALSKLLTEGSLPKKPHAERELAHREQAPKQVVTVNAV
jgi:hypothetical protein